MMIPTQVQPMGQPGMMQPGMMPGMAAPGMVQPMVMGPAGPQMLPTTQVNVVSGGALQLLNSLSGVYIAQRENALEILTGIQLSHKFHFYPMDANENPQPNRIFRGNDQSNAIVRNIVSADNRPFEMFITMTNGPVDLFNFMYLERPMVCCRCDNGEMRIYCMEGGQRLVGTIRGPCTFCNYELNVYDANDNLRYTMGGTCCQVGLCCGKVCPCEGCSVSTFQISDPSGNVQSEFKRKLSCCTQICTTQDNYILHFPKTATADDKMLLMGAMVLWDFVYFEKPKNESQGCTVEF